MHVHKIVLENEKILLNKNIINTQVVTNHCLSYF